MTARLYYSDSYLSAFTARVHSVDGVRVHLASTAFYPTSGGQPHDVGVLGGATVVDVIDDGDSITHVLEGPAPFAAGDEVSGTVDWARRFDYMQQHTGQHLLSAVLEDLFGYRTTSVHFGADYSTLDLDTDSLSRDRAVAAERRANEVVLENHRVTVGFEDATTAAGLRKPSDRTGEIRIVTIEGLDRSACGGTHVRSTSEIGPLAIRKVERQKKAARVEFLCGWRALDRARADFEALSRIAAGLSAGLDEVPEIVEAQAAGLRAAENDRKKLGEELARARARDRYEATIPDADGVRRMVERTGSMEELRAAGLATGGLPRAIFVGFVASPPSVVFAASEDSGVNAGAVLKAALAPLGGRGGGSPRMAQGTVGDQAALGELERVLMATALV